MFAQILLLLLFPIYAKRREREKKNFLSLGRERCPLLFPGHSRGGRSTTGGQCRRRVSSPSSFLEESESFFSSISFRLVALNELPDHKRDGDGIFLLILGLGLGEPSPAYLVNVPAVVFF